MFPKFRKGGREGAQIIAFRQATCQQSMSRHFKRIEKASARSGVAFAAAARDVWCISNSRRNISREAASNQERCSRADALLQFKQLIPQPDANAAENQRQRAELY
jgi:hypothetical protein